MKKMLILSLCLMMAVLFCGCGDGAKTVEKAEGGFSLTVRVDRTSARVGDIVKITAVFKNLGGKDIPIELADWQHYPSRENLKIDAIVEIAAMPQEAEWAKIDVQADPRQRETLKKDAVITQTVEYRIDEWKSHKVLSRVCFYMGEDYGEFYGISSEPIMIAVRLI